jgi:hypothetical protein
MTQPGDAVEDDICSTAARYCLACLLLVRCWYRCCLRRLTRARPGWPSPLEASVLAGCSRSRHHRSDRWRRAGLACVSSDAASCAGFCRLYLGARTIPVSSATCGPHDAHDECSEPCVPADGIFFHECLRTREPRGWLTHGGRSVLCLQLMVLAMAHSAALCRGLWPQA